MKCSTIFYCLLLISLFQVSCQHQLARSIAYDSFDKPAENPVLRADSTYQFNDPLTGERVRWQKADVFNPAAIVQGDQIKLLYRSEDNPAAHLGGRTSRIGMATSKDGVNFDKMDAPVLYPKNDEWAKYDAPGGCEDPRVVVTKDGLYVMTYTAWNYKVPRLSIATSRDLLTWEKHGPAFAKAYEGKFKDSASKSGSILTRPKGNQFVVAEKNGKYWMYWGEHGVNLAWSDNLTDWYPELNEDGSLHYLIEPRDGYFDSHLTECGPPALLLKEGMTLIYNGRNNENTDKADPNLPTGMYSVGRVVFDKKDWRTVVKRSNQPFLKPTLSHEVTGQYKSGTTFAEGLVWYKNKWFLYYGTADSFVGVAVTDAK
jgi:predicted GH43/DUF377 family glycosyl hydrolase